jgi:RNA polymerase sigma factor (sigma-70 family)
VDDTICLAHIRQGGERRHEAVRVLYGRYAPRFRRYFRKNRVPVDCIEDLVQDVFVNIVKACEQFRSESALSVWLWKIARNHLSSYFRRVRPEVPLEEDDPPEDDFDSLTLQQRQALVSEQAAGHSIEDCVRKAFAAFEKDCPDRAHVLSLVAIEEWEIADVAELLGRTAGATREYISQCRKRFRPYLETCRDYLEEVT